MRHTFLLFLALAACNDSTLSVQKYAPEVEIFSHGDGATVLEGAVQRFQGSEIDNDDPPSDLIATWSSNARELCPPAPPADDGISTCEVALTPEDTSVSLVVVDSDNQHGDDHLTLIVVATDAPTADLLAPIAEGVYYSDRLIAFEAQVGDAEDAPDALTLAWSSSLAGALDLVTAVDSSGHATTAGNLSEGEHYLTLTVTDSGGKSATDSVVIEVGPPNTAPECAIVEPADGSMGQAGASVTFKGRVSDADIAADQLTVDWVSDRDGALSASSPDSSGNVVFSTSALTSGTHTISMNVADELGETCSQLIQYTVSTPPTIVVNTPMDGDVVEEGATVVFDADVYDAEDNPDDLTVAWVSTLDGTISLDGADPSGNILFGLDILSVGEHTILVTVTDTTGLYTREMFDITVNGVPTAPGVSLTPDPAWTDDVLTVSIDTASTDPNGDPITYTYAWYVNGALSAASTSSTLPASATTRGETWEVVVTPNDGLSDGASASAGLTIGNSVPALSSVTITPNPAYFGDTLTCAWSGWTDADSDADASTVLWSINGVAASTASTLSSGFVSGDTVMCTVTPDDGTDTGTALSDSITIGNSPPEITALTLTPAAPGTDDTLVTTATTSDADGDTVRLAYEWEINGALVAASSSKLAGTAWFDRGDTVTVTATPYDGADYGTPMSASVTIENTAPTTATIEITPDPPDSNDDLICEITADATDTDGDTLSYTIEWDVDGIAYTAATTTYETGDTVPGSATTRGEIWTCTVTANDGTDDGPAATDSVTIGTGTCDSPGFSGTTGTSWTHLAVAPNYLFSLMTFKPDDFDYVYNAYGTNLSYYDPTYDTWASVSSSTPCNSVWNSMAPYDGDLWMIRCGNVYQYDVSADSWTTHATYAGGDDYNQTVADCDGNIYGHSNNGSIVEYNVSAGTVTQYSDGHGSLSETRLVYDPTEEAVYFGAFSAGNLYRFDTTAKTFSTMTSHPESFLNDIVCGDWSGHLYAAGGSSGTSIYQYDMAADSWATITAFPVDHGNNGSCTVGTEGTLYMADYDTSKFYKLTVY